MMNSLKGKLKHSNVNRALKSKDNCFEFHTIKVYLNYKLELSPIRSSSLLPAPSPQFSPSCTHL